MDRWNALSKRGQAAVGAVGLLFACAICSNVFLGGDSEPAEPTSAPLGLVSMTEAPNLPPTTASPQDTPRTADIPATVTADLEYIVPTERPTEPPTEPPTVPPPTDAPPTAAPPTEPPATEVPPPTEAPQPPVAGCVNINTASLDDLKRIIHIDEERAAEIVQLRQIRPFRSVDELTRVKGIGDKRLAEIKAEGIACVY